MPDLVAGAVDVDTAGHDALREVRDVEDDAETSDKVGEYHPADHLELSDWMKYFCLGNFQFCKESV